MKKLMVGFSFAILLFGTTSAFAKQVIEVDAFVPVQIAGEPDATLMKHILKLNGKLMALDMVDDFKIYQRTPNKEHGFVYCLTIRNDADAAAVGNVISSFQKIQDRFERKQEKGAVSTALKNTTFRFQVKSTCSF